jgi:hypothetical protein
MKTLLGAAFAVLVLSSSVMAQTATTPVTASVGPAAADSIALQNGTASLVNDHNGGNR